MDLPNSSNSSVKHKPVLDDRAFAQIAAIAHKEAGLAISPKKAAMVHTRVARRLRALNMTTYDQYCALVASDAGAAERRELVSVLTTNVSHFFREDHHFERLKEDVLPGLFQKMRAGKRVRIWSAGCSNGQEPYSIAMAILEYAPLPPNADLKILGSDIDPNVISFARQGIYDQSMITGLPDREKNTYFTAVLQDTRPAWQVQTALKDLVTFRELNLLHPWPMKGSFDVIFCRNVVIYFDENTQETLWKNFAEVLTAGGWLFLGHSERVSEEHLEALPPVGMTTYRRVPIPDS